VVKTVDCTHYVNGGVRIDAIDGAPVIYKLVIGPACAQAQADAEGMYAESWTPIPATCWNCQDESLFHTNRFTDGSGNLVYCYACSTCGYKESEVENESGEPL
jgi:hypothetical protein